MSLGQQFWQCLLVCLPEIVLQSAFLKRGFRLLRQTSLRQKVIVIYILFFANHKNCPIWRLPTFLNLSLHELSLYLQINYLKWIILSLFHFPFNWKFIFIPILPTLLCIPSYFMVAIPFIIKGDPTGMCAEVDRGVGREVREGKIFWM